MIPPSSPLAVSKANDATINEIKVNLRTNPDASIFVDVEALDRLESSPLASTVIDTNILREPNVNSQLVDLKNKLRDNFKTILVSRIGNDVAFIPLKEKDNNLKNKLALRGARIKLPIEDGSKQLVSSKKNAPGIVISQNPSHPTAPSQAEGDLQAAATGQQFEAAGQRTDPPGEHIGDQGNYPQYDAQTPLVEATLVSADDASVGSDVHYVSIEGLEPSGGQDGLEPPETAAHRQPPAPLAHQTEPSSQSGQIIAEYIDDDWSVGQPATFGQPTAATTPAPLPQPPPKPELKQETLDAITAIDQKDQQALQALIATGEVELTKGESDYGNTPLLQAVYKGNTEAALALIEADDSGESLKVTDNTGGKNTPLLLALKRGETQIQSAIFAKLLKLEPQLVNEIVNAADSRGATALHWAAIDRNEVLLEQLIEFGADVKAQTLFSSTAGDLYREGIGFEDLEFPKNVTFGTAEKSLDYSGTEVKDFSNFRWHGIAKAQNELAAVGNPFLPDDVDSPTNHNLTPEFIAQLDFHDYDNGTKNLLDLAKLKFVEKRANIPVNQETLSKLPVTEGKSHLRPEPNATPEAQKALNEKIDRKIGTLYEQIAKKINL